MSPTTIARPVMTDLASAVYTVLGEALDAAMREAERKPSPDAQHAMEAIALAYQSVAEEYGLS